jgi:hypothetical protein
MSQGSSKIVFGTPRHIAHSSTRWGGFVAAYECSHDAFERWHPEGLEETVRSQEELSGDPEHYQKRRRHFEIILFIRDVSGSLDYYNLNIRAFHTEAECIEAYELLIAMETAEDALAYRAPRFESPHPRWKTATPAEAAQTEAA